MARRLTDTVTSQYVEAANRLKPKRHKRRVVVYVESYDDVFFWRSVLEEFESAALHFEVMLPSRTTLGKGKKLAMHNHLGPNMIACVDADYDYLMQGRSDISRELLESPYIFHTYVYAIENYQCYAPGLHEACVMSTLNDREVLDLEAFMRELSVIIWPLFVWSIWAYRHDEYKRFSLCDVLDTVALRDVNTFHPEQSIDHLKRRVNKKIAWLQQNFHKAKGQLEPLRRELLQLGVTPETSYLYIQGHTLFDGIVLPLLGPVCTLLRRERENEIKRLACHETQRQNELACYQHSVSPIDMMLKKGTKFRCSEPYKRMRADIEHFVSGLQSSLPSSADTALQGEQGCQPS
ncbi:MAG: DUF4435 domain-containing protein [Bacteroidales bacterium]|nr:DUF4435 domain-containing protein [Candidatus Physcousia equi]